jgi:hypothetical protein
VLTNKPSKDNGADHEYRGDIEDEPSIEHAVHSWKDPPADFADCLIEARNARPPLRSEPPTTWFEEAHSKHRKTLKNKPFLHNTLHHRPQHTIT